MLCKKMLVAYKKQSMKGSFFAVAIGMLLLIGSACKIKKKLPKAILPLPRHQLLPRREIIQDNASPFQQLKKWVHRG